MFRSTKRIGKHCLTVQRQPKTGQYRAARSVRVRLWMTKLLLITLFVGCHRLQLPAIDPNGSCLFLPFPTTTQLQVPPVHSSGDQTGFLPVPAYQAPPAPPPCPDGNCEPSGTCNLFHRKHDCLHKIHDHFRSPGKVGEIQMTPLKVVAPVGGEVVFLAGICGEDGYLVKQEPLEWMLSPESVGQIIEVNDDAPGKLSGFLNPHRPKVEKLDIDFARGRTSSKAQIIDRGTPACTDDIHLKDGETWVSVSSPTAGVSRLTVLAPDSKLWDRRRQTAVVYWLDAQWVFPPPQIAASGGSVQFATRVTKAEGLVPATDWFVQYTIVDPSIASFVNQTPSPTGSNQSRVRVDENGMGIVNISAAPNARGTTGILIEVISPAMPSDHLPEIVVGRGETFATFSSPGLNVQAFGPNTASVGEVLSYSAALGNPGDLNAENARLTLTLPSGLRLQSAVPQPTSQTDLGAVWDQGVLAANRQLDVVANVEAVQPGVYDLVFQADAAGLSSRSSVRTEVAEASLEVRFAPAGGISQAEVGSIVEYEIDITNRGRQTLTNLKLTVEADPGIVEVSQGVSKVEQEIGTLSPGESRSIGIPFQIRQEGQQSVRLNVTSPGQKVLAQSSSSILGLPARPKRPEIGVKIQFPVLEPGSPPKPVEGQTYKALITVQNSGDIRLTQLNLEVTTDAEVLEFTGVDVNNRNSIRPENSAKIIWTPADMLPGQGADVIRSLWINVRARRASPSATIAVRAWSAENIQAQDSAQVEIVAQTAIQPPVQPPAQPVLPQDPQSTDSGQDAGLTGALSISINDFNDPTRVGSQIRYGLRVANNSNRPNRRVHIQLLQPQGTRLLGFSKDGETIAHRFGSQGTVLLPVIEYMRPGEELYYILVLVPEVVQEMRVDARVYSDVFPNPIQASQTTTVVAQ